MPDFVERMKDEAKDLEAKCLAAKKFNGDPKNNTLSQFEILLLTQQIVFMENYLNILYKRIAFYSSKT